MPNALERAFTRTISKTNIKVYRATKGRVWNKMLGMPVLLMTVKGRRTGRPRTKPLVYFTHNGAYVVTGSLGGAPQEPLWFRNLREAKTVIVEVGSELFEADVEIATDEEHPELWAKATSLASFFADYQARTERKFPMAKLTPRKS